MIKRHERLSSRANRLRHYEATTGAERTAHQDRRWRMVKRAFRRLGRQPDGLDWELNLLLKGT